MKQETKLWTIFVVFAVIGFAGYQLNTTNTGCWEEVNVDGETYSSISSMENDYGQIPSEIRSSYRETDGVVEVNTCDTRGNT